MDRKPWTDQQVDVRVGRLLQAGVILAVLVMLGGALVFLFEYGHSVPNYQAFQDDRSTLRSLNGIVTLALRGDGSGLIQMAVLVMIATPIVRVIFAVFAFLRGRDWLYALISLTVLSLLLYGLTFGV